MAVIPDVVEAQRALVDAAVGDRYLVEIVGGRLVVTPSAGWSHNVLVAGLASWLAARAPVPLEVATEQDVSADGSGTSREPHWRPDVVVSAGPSSPGREWLVADEVVIAVEVVSPGNVADAGSAEAYLRRRAMHGALHGSMWLLGVHGDAVSWWWGGMATEDGPDWAAGLRIAGGRVVGL